MNDTATKTDMEEAHLGWTKKQGYILSGGGRAEELYTSDRGFPFVETDLPHYHILQGDTHATFRDWTSSKPSCDLVCGAWNRSLFVGGWKHSSHREERVYNVQTHNLFIDLRIPKSRELVLVPSLQKRGCTSLKDLTPHELCLYARQHVFSGFTVLESEKGRPVATRHHCIDWNFVGVSRPRPNKWWIEVDNAKHVSCWKEYAYATDDHGQHYYFEQWDRLKDGNPKVARLALRLSANPKKRKACGNNVDNDDDNDNNTCAPPAHQQKDGVFVLVGDHFNYMMSRKFTSSASTSTNVATSLVDLVDMAVAAGDLETARSYLSIEAAHGTVSSGWKLDCAIPPWNEGTELSSIMNGPMVVHGSDIASCIIEWGGEIWDIYDCSFENIEKLKGYLAKV